VQRQTSATQYNGIYSCQKALVISIAFSDHSFNQISVDSPPNIFFGDRHSETAMFKLVRTPEYGEKIVYRSIGPFEYSAV